MTEAISTTAHRPGLLRVGLVLGTVLLALDTIPSVMVGFDGSAWDPVVIVIAVASVAMLITALVLLVPAWRGRRSAGIVIAVLLLVSILPALPPFFLPAEEVPAGGLIAAGVGAVLHAIAATLILLGIRQPSMREA